MLFRAGLLALLLFARCDHGLEPPTEPPLGAIRGIITYLDTPAAWPPQESLFDLRFVGMRFVPQDTADFLQLNRMAISPTLAFYVPSDTFLIANVAAGTFFYSGVAQRFGQDILAWRPVGLYTENEGIFEVLPGDTTLLRLTVDFRSPPPFPPQPR